MTLTFDPWPPNLISSSLSQDALATKVWRKSVDAYRRYRGNDTDGRRHIKTRKPSCRWQTRATPAKSLNGLRKSSGVVSCIASLPIDSVPMVSYYVLYSKCVCKMRRFGDTRLLKLPWPWNPGQGSLSNFVSKLHRFRDMTTYWSKIAETPQPTLI